MLSLCFKQTFGLAFDECRLNASHVSSKRRGDLLIFALFLMNFKQRLILEMKRNTSFVCDTSLLTMIGLDIYKCGVSQTLKTPCAVKGYKKAEAFCTENK